MMTKLSLLPSFDPNNWRTCHSTITINTPRQHVWAILSDFRAYDDWNPFTYAVEMPSFEVGEVFQFTVKLGQSERLQKELITRIEAPDVMAWRYPFKDNIWLSPTRYQVLTPIDDMHTQYQT
ncbi:MAG: SRPBCC family protein [Phototrophicaceae bacterium]